MYKACDISPAGHGVHTEHLELGDATGDNTERRTAPWTIFTNIAERENTFQEVGRQGETIEIWMEED